MVISIHDDAFKNDLENAERMIVPIDRQIPTNDTKRLTKAYSDDLHEPTIGSLSVGDKPVDETKPTEFATSINAFTTYGSKDNGTIGEIPQHPSEALKTSIDEDLDALPSAEYLTEQHCKDTQTIEVLRYDLKESERLRKLEAESSDTWRNKYIASDKEMEKHVIENRNLKSEIAKMNQLLEQAYAKDALMDGVMKLYLDTKSKLNDSVEGEVVDKWR